MTQNIFISKRKESEIITNPIIPCYYKASDYGLSTKYSGKNVKIAIIDSGCPSHKDIMDPEGFISFINKHQDIKDIHGHSTMISGILTAQNKNCVNGLATGSLYYHAKVIDDQGHCDFAPLVAAILWSIIKEVDIILLAMGTKTDYSVLHDAIKKAYESNICIIAASGNIKDEEEADFPARYLEVLSVGNKKDGGKNKKLFSYGNHIDIPLLADSTYTTYLNDQYIKVSGSSLSAAVATGLMANIIDKNKVNNLSISPQSIYAEMGLLKHNGSL